MDIEMSLDDIIQRKRINLNTSRKGGFRGRRFKRNENNNFRSNLKSNGNYSAKGRGGLIKPRVRGGGGSIKRSSVVGDARLKIIQKTRSKLTDARDKLVEKAKQTGDARLKLKKLQEKRLKLGQKQRKRGQPPFILRSVNPSEIEPTITIPDDSGEDDDMEGGGAPVLCRTINNNSFNRLGVSGLNNIHILNEVDRSMSDDKMYSSWSQSRSFDLRSMQQSPSQLKIVTHNDQAVQGRLHSDWEYETPASSLCRTSAIKKSYGQSLPINTYEDDQFRTYRNSRISQEMKARLDTPATPVSRSMGVLAQPSVPNSQPVGHRIVVSNLQPSVTHEDIKELFEDIGPLVMSHVVRPGTAEVIYVHQKDAIAAVDAYHNRQLDGQPMKCLLVPSRPSTLSGARTGSGTKYPSSTKSAVLPDISAIHKALFNK